MTDNSNPDILKHTATRLCVTTRWAEPSGRAAMSMKSSRFAARRWPSSSIRRSRRISNWRIRRENSRLRAEKRCGELLWEMKEREERAAQGSTGGHNKKRTSDRPTFASNVEPGQTPPPTLAELGISKQQSADWQKLAAIPEDQFEEMVENEPKPTTAGLIAKSSIAAKQVMPKKPSQSAFPQELALRDLIRATTPASDDLRPKRRAQLDELLDYIQSGLTRLAAPPKVMVNALYLIPLREEITQRRKEANAPRVQKKTLNPDNISNRELIQLIDRIDTTLDGFAPEHPEVTPLREEITRRREANRIKHERSKWKPSDMITAEQYRLLNYIEDELDRLMQESCLIPHGSSDEPDNKVTVN